MYGMSTTRHKEPSPLSHLVLSNRLLLTLLDMYAECTRHAYAYVKSAIKDCSHTVHVHATHNAHQLHLHEHFRSPSINPIPAGLYERGIVFMELASRTLFCHVGNPVVVIRRQFRDLLKHTWYAG